ncbi:hypothetical protein AMK26_03945 [Streptomyces sp. CB03234]|uniref:hypothetical protein n=1 Tax=Streptomyces sp. (strain CB03234) TaxID=1703937 RepID=UPI00093A7B59|nr:hypothetical protein [Streptomyces sp. CB03234]OKK08182.1 hypothetical protein AMK26_03945 [Streptomyces sp. CB03234]
MALVAGVAVLALLLLLATCGTGDQRPSVPPAKAGAAPVTRLTVPDAYDTSRGWDITGVSPEYVIARTTGVIAYLERVDDTRFRLRTLDARTGRHGWAGRPWRPLGDPESFPGLLALEKEGRRFFVTWSYGRTGDDPLTTAGSFVSLDLYDAADGTRQRVEVPWADVPIVTGTGPGVLISDGRTRSAVVAPDTGEVSTVPPQRLGHPKGCAECRRLTAVRGVTSKGLLVSGARGFWVPGGWFSRDRAPAGADPASGVPGSLTSGHVLARWQHKKGAARAATHDIWAVHEARTGRPLVKAECRRPAIEPGEYPQAVVSPGGRYLIAGSLAFDLDARTGRCFEEADGSTPLTLTTVTDGGVAYGASGARSVADALAGGGSPVAVDLATGVPQALAPSVRLPAAEVAGVGVYRWTDARDRVHLTGYARTA